ncbi:DUF6388 family protein [Cupriavidus basilensis]|uniref:DUF6388 family protein n=1 Tax=Cupriavidus TaxID=106589 RepID=UPI0023E7C6AD|nr:DUF6388 family protein [Cupriavidus basilensis]MDF3889222.1 DUF6388 family protein [Cupriavidus basilensis]
MTLSPERLQLAHERFLADNPEVVALLKVITERHARAVGMSVEAFQRSELERAIGREARLRRLTVDELLLVYLGERAAPAPRR